MSLRVLELLQEILDLSPGERAARLAELPTDERQEIVSMLEFENVSTLDFALTLTELRPEGLEGRQVGPYRIDHVLGEGGMGVVYEAVQNEPIRRTVALKVIKWGMDTRSVIARFTSERQALALMEHPNIARVFDAGATESGRPYFVMELVHGEPITDYCDRRQLGIGDRLAIFQNVCRGVQHAHQKGIIHRDLKPSNVFVTEIDGTAVPKIIDFGIAKATAKELTDETVMTEFGQLVGTPEYMSPEQVSPAAVFRIDTRSDIYSLGVLLYELLVGSPPFDFSELRSAGFEEIRRRIREQEPAKPSTRVSRMGDKSSAARDRGLEEAGFTRRLEGDLDWIVMKALEKEPARRYETASAFALDIERHLEDEPVRAGPPSTAYRVQKFVRRHRLAVAATSVIALSVLLGTAGIGIGLLRAIQERDRAVEIGRQQSALRLAAESSQAFERNERQLSLLLALEAVEQTQNAMPAAETALRRATRAIQGTAFSVPHESVSGALTGDGRWLVAGLGSNVPLTYLWDTTAPDPHHARVLLRGSAGRGRPVMSQDQRYLITSCQENKRLHLADRHGRSIHGRR